ncbi:MAG: hypothetical protein FWC91_07650 [Defluviitaleaceae bacterium]|nr:hypothetical protein [Defluviitaleaceae bacterium]
MKKFISLLLVFSILLGINTTGFAAEDNDYIQDEVELDYIMLEEELYYQPVRVLTAYEKMLAAKIQEYRELRRAFEALGEAESLNEEMYAALPSESLDRLKDLGIGVRYIQGLSMEDGHVIQYIQGITLTQYSPDVPMVITEADLETLREIVEEFDELEISIRSFDVYFIEAMEAAELVRKFNNILLEIGYEMRQQAYAEWATLSLEELEDMGIIYSLQQSGMLDQFEALRLEYNPYAEPIPATFRMIRQTIPAARDWISPLRVEAGIIINYDFTFTAGPVFTGLVGATGVMETVHYSRSPVRNWKRTTSNQHLFIVNDNFNFPTSINGDYWLTGTLA